MAKFKKGDKVRYLIGTDEDKAKVHTVLETTMEGGREMVWFDDDGRGGNGIWADSLVKVNSRACNAKFKVGDRVQYKGTEGRLSNRRGTVSDVSVIGGEVFVTVDTDKDGEWGAPEKDWVFANSRACNGVRSRNAVVAKALNACARNGGIDDFKVGDRVMVRSVVGFTPTDPKPGTVTAIYKSDNSIAVKKDDGGRGLFDASMVTKNACGTARNAVDDAEAQRMWDDFQKKLVAVKRDADTLRSKFRADKHWAYAEQMGFVIQKLDDAVFK